MSKNLTATLIQQKNKIDTRNPWLVALDIVTNKDPVNFQEEYLVNNNEPLVWGNTTYEPAPFKLGTLPAKSSGELPTIDISLFNTLELAQFLNAHDGLIDHPVSIYLVYATQDITSGVWSIAEDKVDYPLKHSYVITECTITRDVVKFKLGVPNYLKRPFPARLFHKDFCDFMYKGEYCWMRNHQYDENDPEEVKLDVCNHTYEDCKRHYKFFDMENTNWKVGIDYGGFPNIGRGSYVYR